MFSYSVVYMVDSPYRHHCVKIVVAVWMTHLPCRLHHDLVTVRCVAEAHFERCFLNNVSLGTKPQIRQIQKPALLAKWKEDAETNVQGFKILQYTINITIYINIHLFIKLIVL